MSDFSPNIDFYQGQYHAHPHCPVAVWDFWVEELMVSRKHVVLMLDTPADKMLRWLAKQVHLLCFVSPHAPQHEFINQEILANAQEQRSNMRNISLMHGDKQNIPLDSDSIDFAIVGHDFAAAKTELSRVLRLNSYVCIVRHKTKLSGSPFADAYAQLLHQYQLDDDYQQLPNEADLKDFFANHYAVQIFSNQLRFTAETWRQYIENAYAFSQWPPQRKHLFLRAARLIFNQFATNGEVLLDCDTHVYTGLFNKNMPAISLRKSVFFQLLRPFAFAFYVLVKTNVYFWRMIYKLSYLLPRRNKQK